MIGRKRGQAAESADIKLFRKLVRDIPERSVVRECAEAVLEDEEIPEAAVPALCEALRTRSTTNWHTRVAACICLSIATVPTELNEQVTGALLAGSLDPENRSSLRFGRNSCLGVGAILLIPVMMFRLGIWPDLDPVIAMVVASVALLAGALWSYFRSDAMEVRSVELAQCCAMRKLAQMRDYRSVGAVARAAMSNCPRVRAEADRALEVLLETIMPEHYGKLPTDVTPTLCKLMEAAPPKRAIQIIRALARAGDGHAAWPMWRMTSTDRIESVRDMALRARPIIDERLTRESASAMLLRPASSDDDTLLRPAANGTSSPPENLLRPAEPDDGKENGQGDGKGKGN